MATASDKITIAITGSGAGIRGYICEILRSILPTEGYAVDQIGENVLEVYPIAPPWPSAQSGPAAYFKTPAAFPTDSEPMKGMQEAIKDQVKAGVHKHQVELLAWATDCLVKETADRPQQNIHKRTITQTWCQVIRFLEEQIRLNF